MRLALALAVVIGMGFAGATLVQSDDIREKAQRLDTRLQGGLDTVLAALDSRSPGPAAEHGSNVEAESLTPASDEPGFETTTVSYIVDTGGVGVSRRTECRADARVPGGLAAGSRVEIVEQGSGDCEGWSLVSTGGARSWVSAEYLSGLDGRASASPRS